MYDYVRFLSEGLQRSLLPCVVLLLVLTNSAQSYAEDEPAAEGEVAAPIAAIYLPIKPAFVVNYGGPGPLKYIKAEVSVRLSSSRAADGVRHHLPYIRNNLVMLFASQTDETLDSQAGKEALRKDALAEVRKILLEEDGLEEGVVDVFFNTLIVQK